MKLKKNLKAISTPESTLIKQTTKSKYPLLSLLTWLTSKAAKSHWTEITKNWREWINSYYHKVWIISFFLQRKFWFLTGNYQLLNSLLQVTIVPTKSELCNLSSLVHTNEYLLAVQRHHISSRFKHIPFADIWGCQSVRSNELKSDIL